MSISSGKKNIILLLVIIAGLLGLASCETDDPGCYQPTVVTAVCGFSVRDTQIVADTLSTNPLVIVDKVLPRFRDSFMDSPEMKILAEDSVLLIRGQKGARELGIAFNQAKDSVRYSFRTDTTSTVYDTITVHYNSSLHFISNGCGYNYYFGIEKVTHTSNMLDSFAILQPEVTEEFKNNIQFYFKRAATTGSIIRPTPTQSTNTQLDTFIK